MTSEPHITHFESYLPFTEEEKLLISQRVLRRKLKRREFIMQAGEIYRHYTFVVHGILRLFVTENEGKEHNILFAPEGDWISDIDSFHAMQPSQSSIQALEPSEVIQIAQQDLYHLYLRFNGMVFRVNQDNSNLESIYIRPSNGRADDQLRKNHAIQYFSYPDYEFDRLRKETPEKYESYADMALNEWITLKIVVEREREALFLNSNNQSSLIINDMKHVPDHSGAVGLWVQVGNEI